MGDPRFRRATPGDAELLLEFMREYYAFDGHAFDQARARVALVTFLREPSYGRAWLVSDAATPVGYIVLTFGFSLEYLGRDAFIDEFYLRESHRGRGWGRKTLDFVEEQARLHEVRSIHVGLPRSRPLPHVEVDRARLRQAGIGNFVVIRGSHGLAAISL